MLGYSEFHHDLIYKYVALFGSLFNGIEVFRQGKDEDERVKVPLNFASVQKVLAFAEKKHLSDQMAIATLVPRMAFEMQDIVYDPSRKMNKFNRVCLEDGSVRSPMPYNLLFQLSIMAKTERDAQRIVEQILPHFDPNLALSMYPFSGDTKVVHDIKIGLTSVSRNNDYQGVAEQRQIIVWNLTFELQGWLYGPKKTGGKVIKKVRVNFHDDLGTTEVYPGLTDEGQPTTDPLQAIDYTLVEQEDDWDFIVEHGEDEDE